MFGGEKLPLYIYGFSALVLFGVVLTATKRFEDFRSINFLEKGVIYASVGSLGMGITNFLTGVGSQTVSPLATIWFTHAFLALACVVYFLWKGNATSLA